MINENVGENLQSVNPDQLKEILFYAIKHQEPVFIEGKTGTGKSQIVFQVCEEYRNGDKEKLGFIDMRAVLYDIGDLLIKFPDKKLEKMVEYVTKALPTKEDNKKRGILFLDEFKQAPTEVRRMFYQLILDRSLGASYKLPNGWIIVAASNLDEEIEQEDLEAPLFDRFVNRIRLTNSLEKWKKWAYSNKINPIVISYLNRFEEKFYMSDDESRAIMTPRRWEWISDSIDNVASDNIIKAKMVPGLSAQFLQYRKLVDRFGDLEPYISGKVKAPQELDQQYALAVSFANFVKNNKTLTIALKTINKLGFDTEVEVFANLSSINKLITVDKNGKKKILEFLGKADKKLREIVIKINTEYKWLCIEEDED